jgi:hypothetical protein
MRAADEYLNDMPVQDKAQRGGDSPTVDGLQSAVAQQTVKVDDQDWSRE